MQNLVRRVAGPFGQLRAPHREHPSRFRVPGQQGRGRATVQRGARRVREVKLLGDLQAPGGVLGSRGRVATPGRNVGEPQLGVGAPVLEPVSLCPGEHLPQLLLRRVEMSLE